jgi:hypothetical protein
MRLGQKTRAENERRPKAAAGDTGWDWPFWPVQVGSERYGLPRSTWILFLLGGRMISLGRRSGRQDDPLS